MKKNLTSVLRKACLPLGGFLASVIAFAQTDVTTSTIFTSLANELKVVNSILRPILTVIGIVTCVYVAINLVKYFKGGRESRQELIKVGVGLVIIVLMVFLSAVIPSA